ncbi:coiled-coil domain-containing protein 83 [Carcharodon carcharias]|uniref:coiled-coil domain-containing protein 83 n=1 Tax=Carcharodon carcharias TaxID=13397 RepID=UPI001B7F3381|nr:coiled-coil domain-containing protein 83 [Carcharodon carcharias]
MAKKKKDNKGSNDDKLTLAEAFLQFRFQLKEKAIEKLTYTIQQHQEMNAQSREQNEQLKKEQKEHIRRLVRKANDLEKELERKEIINNEQVDQAMKEKLELIKHHKQQTQMMRSFIKDLEQKILKEEEVKAYWLEYKNVGSIEHGRIIKVRENELVELVKNFGDIEDHFHRALARAKEDIDSLTKEQMDEKKALAAQKAVSYMGRYSRQQVKENAWLKKELNLYSLEVANLEQAVKKIEEENLEVLSQLFDCQISDLNICRNLLKMHAVGTEGQDSGVLEDDVAVLELRGQPSEIDDNFSPILPKSATILAAENKASLMQPCFKEEKTSDDEPQFQLGKSVSQNLTYLLQDDEKYFEYFECGTLEQKLLHIEGRAMLLKADTQPLSQEKRNEEKSNEVEMVWPVTGTMLRSAIL